MQGQNQDPWIYSHGSSLAWGSRAGFDAHRCPQRGFLHVQSVFVSHFRFCYLALLCISQGRHFPSVWGLCKTFCNSCCLCFPHCLLFILFTSSWSLPHPPTKLPCMTISALTCTSDTPVPRLISPKSVSLAMKASAWHLQAPDSPSPKDFLKTLNFWPGFRQAAWKRHCSKLLKDSILFFYTQLWNKYKNAKLPVGLENGIKSSNKHEKMDTNISISNKMAHAWKLVI